MITAIALIESTMTSMSATDVVKHGGSLLFGTVYETLLSLLYSVEYGLAPYAFDLQSFLHLSDAFNYTDAGHAVTSRKIKELLDKARTTDGPTSVRAIYTDPDYMKWFLTTFARLAHNLCMEPGALLWSKAAGADTELTLHASYTWLMERYRSMLPRFADVRGAH